MIKYYIRQIDFFYSDEASYAVDGLMNLTESYATFAEANAKRWALQQRAFQGMQLDDWEPISSINARTPELEAQWARINDYIVAEFANGSFLVPDEYYLQQTGKKRYTPSREYYLPGQLTIEQVKKLTELTTIELFQVVEVDEADPPFFGIYRLGNYGEPEGWVTVLAGRMGPNGFEEAPVPTIFADEAQLMNGNKEMLHSAVSNIDLTQLNRPLAELTDTPTLVRAFVAALPYNSITVASNDQLKIDYPTVELLGLNPFLRRKLFELRPLPMTTVLKYRGYQALQ